MQKFYARSENSLIDNDSLNEEFKQNKHFDLPSQSQNSEFFSSISKIENSQENNINSQYTSREQIENSRGQIVQSKIISLNHSFEQSNIGPSPDTSGDTTTENILGHLNQTGPISEDKSILDIPDRSDISNLSEADLQKSQESYLKQLYQGTAASQSEKEKMMRAMIKKKENREVYQKSKKVNPIQNQFKKNLKQVQYEITESGKQSEHLPNVPRKKPPIDPKHQQFFEQVIKKINKKPRIGLNVSIRHLNRLQLVRFRIQNPEDHFKYYALTIADIPFDMKHLVSHKWQKVKSLNFNNSKITDEKLTILMESIDSFPDLDWLELSNNLITSKGAVSMIKNIKLCNDLKGLQLNGNSLNSESVQILMGESYEEFKKLRRMNLSKTQQQDQGFKVFCSLAQNLPAYQYLQFADNNLTDSSLSYFANEIQKFTSIKEINLAGNQITDEGVKLLAGQLDLLKNLKDIRLDRNMVGDQGLYLIASKIKNLKNFLNLYLNKNQITNVQIGTLEDFDSVQTLKRVQIKSQYSSKNLDAIKELFDLFKFKNQNSQLVFCDVTYSFRKQKNITRKQDIKQ